MSERIGNSFYRYSRYFKLVYFGWDLILLNLAYLLSFWFRYKTLTRIDNPDATLWFIINLTWVFLVFTLQSYKFIRVEPIEQVLYRTFRLLTWHFVIIFAFIFFLDYDDVSRLRLGYFYGGFLLLIIFFRIVILQVLKHFRKAGYNYRNIVIVGSNVVGRGIVEYLQADLSYGYRFHGYFDKSVPEGLEHYRGNLAQVIPFIRENRIHEVYVAGSEFSPEEILPITDFCEENFIRIRFVPDFSKFTKSRHVQIDFYGNTPVLTTRQEPLERATNRIIKKGFDIVFSLLVILLVFPVVLPILWLLVKLDSRGPFFFTQERSGMNNKPFRCIKIRTMVLNDEANNLQASANDPRITKVGKWLRRYSFDELPQFFNVLAGYMTVVGPRPHMLKHTEEYSKLVKHYLVRHNYRPGVTGWAQVNGLRGETKTIEEMRRRVEFDIWYIENWSPLLDLKIILRTVTNAFKTGK